MAFPGPAYRLRVFLSVDLAGSTAFKNGIGDKSKDGDPFPAWVADIRHFYREFPLLVNQHFRDTFVGPKHSRASDLGAAPVVWKTIGDELLFCARLRSSDHLAACVSSFLLALQDYGRILDSQGRHMDVKGAGWIAAFPAPNVTVTSSELSKTTDYLDEELESEADKKPDRFDFLGRDIDSGFRVARHASSDRFVGSVELSWLLAQAHISGLITCNFDYHGRHVLKGVLRDRPYPVISLDTERSASRKCVQGYERHLTPSSLVTPLSVRDFCSAFMTDEGIELPVLPIHGELADEAKLPESYKKFREAAEITLRENAARDANAKAASEVTDDTSEIRDLPSEVLESAGQQIKKRDLRLFEFLTAINSFNAANTLPTPGSPDAPAPRP